MPSVTATTTQSGFKIISLQLLSPLPLLNEMAPSSSPPPRPLVFSPNQTNKQNKSNKSNLT